MSYRTFATTMMFILSTIAAIAAVVAAEGLKSPLEGYTAVPMTWHGVNTTDGSDVILSGTVEVCRLGATPNPRQSIR